MSRSRLPPTPSMSGEFIVKDQPAIEGTDVFALPPAAIETAASRRSSKSDHFPASPVSPDFMALGRSANKQSSSSGAGAGAGAGTKRALEDFDLPPPPTRTRKIIQMKPKPQQSAPAKSSAAAAGAAGGKGSSKESGKAAAASNNAHAPAPANGKKKQPSATSAAGRKIARKTAHSLIERRRRSKMNEEFTTLKDMIPACTGQEMHKLAILQVCLDSPISRKEGSADKIKASIDYVNYLEQCIKDLKTAGGRHSAAPPRLPPAPPSPTSPEFLEELADSEHEASVSPELLPESASAQAHDTSPSFSPRTAPSTGTTYDFIPASILPSPALGPTHPTETHPSWPASANTSPALQPRPSNASADADVDASAALLMLNQDRRGTADSITEKVTEASLESGNREAPVQESGRRMGMSVKDLLIS